MEDFNLGLMFYKKYYKDIENNNWERNIRSINTKILERRLSNHSNIFLIGDENKIDLKTIYPGVLIGSGYQHETGAEGEFKLGFYFDHTTGFPIIPGSSVKGLLRSAFPGKAKSNKNEKEKYIIEILQKKMNDNDAIIDVAALENQIFEGIQNGHRIPVYKRDIFFEAYPYESLNDRQKFLSDDYITHHENPLKNPNPVKFLKILSNVKFRFQFKLNDFDKGITAEKKKELFEQIIIDLGVGAKTNVGYGQFLVRSNG